MLLIIIFNFVPSINAHSSYFHRQKKTVIKLADKETLQKEWLATQPKMKRYDIPVLNKESIPEILKYFNIETSTYGLDTKPTYNPYAKNIFYWELKNPPAGLICAFFKARKNPFKEKYPQNDDEYTLDDLLKYEIAIEEAFVFWDDQQKTQEEKGNMELIIINLFVDQSKEEAINNYLIKNQIIQEPKLIKLGCYNITPTTGLIAPLPLGTVNGFEIAAIYFDDGVRLLPKNQKTRSLKYIIEQLEEIIKRYQTELNQTEDEIIKELLAKRIESLQEEIKEQYQEIINHQTYTIEDLLRLSNGAKNIYLFSFNTQKRIKSIELPDAIDPYQAIRNWKRENNLCTFPPLVQEDDYEEQSENRDAGFEINSPAYKKISILFPIKIVKHTFETTNCCYFVVCKNDTLQIKLAQKYRDAYVNWMKQCYIKPGISYSAQEIRNKFGRSSRDIYNEEGGKCRYRYVINTFIDEWYVNGRECSGSNNTFYNFYDTTPPPKKPQELM
ncbi:hypothetical protein [Candidatus Phytoplasma australiense]|uniref:Sequence-variable mosaic (SVM) signal sequence domain-containing protein n=1 Tax=Strawberry lethal yellows phytoplasma (CPA) str. NZSb11 TaxID=980422 RepID=R4S021_PHYAS|nr:hypothetical protein [Candidatus Phytoplasma australiense]AGL90149.1 hypothetical protein SLY_0227 [Strawberry lethal yellows phytoplasma (CPA) str. NZSb11]